MNRNKRNTKEQMKRNKMMINGQKRKTKRKEITINEK
jgi:hypothetical protein